MLTSSSIYISLLPISASHSIHTYSPSLLHHCHSNMANIHNNQNHNLYHFCNDQTFAQMWGIVGSVSAGLSPLCFLTDSTGNIVVAGPAMAGIINTVLIVAASIYFGCYLLRRTAAMRVRRGWIESAAINLVVSIIVAIVAVERKATASDIFGLSLVAVAVFALSEVAKPC